MTSKITLFIYKVLLLLFFCIMSVLSLWAQQDNYTIKGVIRDSESSEALPGVHIYLPGEAIGTVSNNYGYYSLTLPAGKHDIQFSYVGYLTERVSLVLEDNKRMDVSMKAAIELEAVEIEAERHSAGSPMMSVVRLPVKQVNNLPTFLGERDIMKTLQLMPGIKKKKLDIISMILIQK